MNCRINYLYERFPNNPEFASHLEKIELDIWNTLKNEGFPRFQYEGINYFTLSPKMSKEYKHQMKVMQNMRDKYGSQELFLMKKLPPFDYSLIQLSISKIEKKEFEKFNNLDGTGQQEVIPTSSVFNEEAYDKFKKASSIFTSVENNFLSSPLTSKQIKQIKELKQSDPRWNKYSDEDVQRFIDSVFPDSKVKQIKWHSRFTVNNIFNKDRWKNGFYSGTKEQADLMSEMAEDSGNIMVTSALLINIKNPKVTNYTDRNVEDYKNTNDSFIIKATEKDALQLINGRDGYNIENFKEEYVVFEPEQIYILNSDKAIADMERFVNNKEENNFEDNVSCFI